MPVALYELSNLFLGEWIPEHQIPLLPNPLLRYLGIRPSRHPVPLSVKASRAERGEARGLPESNGLDGRVGLGVRVSEVEGEVGVERRGLFLLLGARWGFGLRFRGFSPRFRGFSDRGEGRVVEFVAERGGVLLRPREEQKGRGKGGKRSA